MPLKHFLREYINVLGADKLMSRISEMLNNIFGISSIWCPNLLVNAFSLGDSLYIESTWRWKQPIIENPKRMNKNVKSVNFRALQFTICYYRTSIELILSYPQQANSTLPWRNPLLVHTMNSDDLCGLSKRVLQEYGSEMIRNTAVSHNDTQSFTCKLSSDQ